MTEPARPAPRYGSDLLVDLLHALGIEYVSFNPGASFRGLHDSLVNHGGDRSPRTILCTHEEISVALAHGYYKATGRPMAAALHDVVGLQHASMAIYNAWVDRVPILLLGGTGAVDASKRRPWIEWIHTALVQGNHIRDFVKFDDQPASVPAAVESIIRAYRLMGAQPTAPVYVCLDIELQEGPLPAGAALPADLARWTAQSPVQADATGLAQAAEWLAAARSPVIVAGKVGRSAEGVTALRALAEGLAAPVIDGFAGFNFASTHPQDATGANAATLTAADVILAADVVDLWGTLRPGPSSGGPRTWSLSPGAKVISLSAAELLVHSWSSDYNRLQPVDLALVGDTKVALPALASLVAERLRPADKGMRETRRVGLAAASAKRRADWASEARAEGSKDRITPAWLAFCLRDAVAKHDWVLSNSSLDEWTRRLLPINERYQWTGGSGGAGVGYGIGASLGVALAHKGTGRIVVDAQPDGDLLYCTSALWTAAAERLPLLMVMNNNRTFGNSERHGGTIAEHRGRPVERRGIGTRVDSPPVDYASVARGFGISASGPVVRPADLPRALATAVEAAAAGEPYLLDVVTELL